jgi:hypothetical protein
VKYLPNPVQAISRSLGLFNLFFLLVCSIPAKAQDTKLQGIFVYSFARYVQWPEAYSQGDFIISIVGDSPMVAELQSLADKKKVDGRTIKLVKANSVSEVKRCHILFLPDSQSYQLASALNHVNEWATLVVTQQEGLAKKGSCINFVIRDGNLAFEMNMAAINKKQLKVFAELTKRAIVI